jgi:leader peptidase (prepilin peptidase) / N-methyltransferase
VILAEFPLWFLRAFGFGMGLLWGSFLNVVIYRMPRQMSVATPPSHCPKCKTPIKPWDNIPVVSFLLMGGKARCCGVKVSPRYALVEAAGGLLALAIVETQVRALPGSTPLGQAAALFGAYFFVVLALLAAAFIDLEHMYLPNEITLGGTALGIVTATVRGYTFKQALIGAVVGFCVVYLPLNVLYKLLRGKTGMGMGDAKLLSLCGAWGGWEASVFALFAGSVIASVFTIGLRIFGVKLELPEAVQEELAELRKAAEEGDEEAKQILAEDPVAEDTGDSFMGRRLPFGPFLILALFAYFFGLAPIVKEWFAALFVV